LGNSVVLSDVGSNIVVAVADVSSNGNFLDVLIVNDLSTGRVGLYRYDLRFLSRFQIVSGPRIVEMKRSPNGQNSASVLVSQAGVPTLLVAPSDTISTTSVTRANSYAVTWTPQGELVEANFTDDSVRISSAPFNAPTSLLDGTIDYSPSFPTFALV
jgi:YD repeat-containing protein